MAIEDSVGGAPALTGDQLRDRYWKAMHDLTLGLVRRQGNSVMVGPIELLRFGEPLVGAHSVEWPVEGGLLARAPRGRWRVSAEGGTAVASLDDFEPSLPRKLYAASHLQVHLLFTRLFLLGLRGRAAAPGVRALQADRARAAAVDIALCLTVSRIMSRRARPGVTLAVLAGYHITCWTLSGRTLGAVMMGQRVVAVDGRPLTPAQSFVRFVCAPLAWVMRRPVHDEIAGTDVILDQKIRGG